MKQNALRQRCEAFRAVQISVSGFCVRVCGFCRESARSSFGRRPLFTVAWGNAPGIEARRDSWPKAMITGALMPTSDMAFGQECFDHWLPLVSVWGQEWIRERLCV